MFSDLAKLTGIALSQYLCDITKETLTAYNMSVPRQCAPNGHIRIRTHTLGAFRIRMPNAHRDTLKAPHKFFDTSINC